ncbi:unknown protein [Rivularia sp. IAM M-261]|nr:unknown protein [Rivularia sp. IAM M-261]
MAAINFLVNGLAGLGLNVTISSVIGMLTGVGASLAFNPLLMLTGVLIGGATVAILRTIEQPKRCFMVIDGGIN